VPQLNEAIQLAPFPDDAFRYKVVFLVVATIFGTLLWDRFCTWLFAPKVFAVMLDEAKRTTAADLLPVLMTALKIVGVVVILGTGNILLMGAAFWMWRKSKANDAAAAQPQPTLMG
jgi:cation-transporting ATPase 13A1